MAILAMLPLPFQRRPERTNVEDVLCYGTRCYSVSKSTKNFQKCIAPPPPATHPKGNPDPSVHKTSTPLPTTTKTCLTESCFVHSPPET